MIAKTLSGRFKSVGERAARTWANLTMVATAWWIRMGEFWLGFGSLSGKS
jgi:hypothetical protein